MRITTRRERERLARACGTTVAYLYQIAGGHRRAGAGLTLKLERATAGAICRCNLRPDLFPPQECHCRRSCTCPAYGNVPDRAEWHLEVPETENDPLPQAYALCPRGLR